MRRPGVDGREQFTEIAERIGEDPARYLDSDVVERGRGHTTSTGRDLLFARIRGIDRLGVINAWIQVERALERGPREPVITLLERRRDWLLENGDSEDRPDGEREPSAPKEVVFLDEDGEPYERSSIEAKLRERREAAAAAVATDGGCTGGDS